MSQPKWTAAQRHAMETQGRNLLLSAAAGSGKTATLTARIIRSLTAEQDPADISRLLVVTFTRAAASELRTRISAALSAALAEQPGNRHLTRQLISLGSASICTIDSFCLTLVRTHFQTLSLPPDFRLADETELAVLRRDIMEDLIGEYYDKKSDGAFAALCEHFTGMRDDDRLAEIFTDLYQKVIDYPEGLTFFRNCAEMHEREAALPFLQTHLGAAIARAARERLQEGVAVMEQAIADICDGGKLQKAYEAPFLHDLTTCRTLLEALEHDDYEGVRSTLAAYAPMRLGAVQNALKTPDSIRACAQRKQLVDQLRDELPARFAMPQDKLPDMQRSTAQVCAALYELLTDYHRRLSAEKTSRSVCDFGDIRRLSYQLLVGTDGMPTDIAREIATRYDAIYIDEYQDVDAVQDAIFRAIAQPNNRFMVGDIKQSIYGFRGADPSIFAEYRRSYPILDGADAQDATQLSESVFMSENFRCDRHVIDFVNAVCSYLFAACGESIGYVPQDDLIFAKAEPEGYDAPRVRVCVMLPPDKDEQSAADESTQESEDAPSSEVRYVVGEITRLLREGRKADGSRIRPGDIAILSRSERASRAFSDALEQAGIPVSTAAQKAFFENPEVLLLLCLLNTIDNPTRDIPLAGTLRSPLFGFTMDDLVLIRTRTPDTPLIDAVRAMAQADGDDPLFVRCRSFLRTLERYRDLARALPVDRLLRQLYRETCLLAYAGAGDEARDSGSVRARRTNLLRFYEYARRFEAGSFKGLYQFITYINGIIDEGTQIEFGGSMSADSVQVMTIHKSKGLEFPVCFICGAAARFNKRDISSNSMLFDRSMGLALRLPDSTGFARFNTPMRIAIADHISEQSKQEEMRILYVALTRARERLYITAKTRSSREAVEQAAALRAARGAHCRTALMDCSSYLDWILTALYAGRGGDCYELDMLSPSEVDAYLQGIADGDVDVQPLCPACEDAPHDTPDEEKTLLWEQTLTHRYPYSHLTALPSKISVSALHPGVLDEQWGAAADTSIEEDDVRFAQEDAAVQAHMHDLPLPQDELGGMFEKWLSRTPAFCRESTCDEVSAAQRGTATHLFLQFCDMARAKHDGVRAEAARLTEQRFLPPHIAEQIHEQQLTRFFDSKFYASLCRARRVWREQRFQLLLPAACFTEDAAYAQELQGEVLLVQGVIDLFFEDEDGRLILCDYKTDALTREELASPTLAQKKLSERHRRQLSYYAAALERLCGRAPDEVVIYSLPLGDTVRLDVEKMI